MSCKPKYVNRLESASHWKHKKHAPHESAILGTHGLTPARTKPQQVSPVPQETSGWELGTWLFRTGCICRCLRMCVTLKGTRKGPRKGETQNSRLSESCQPFLFCFKSWSRCFGDTPTCKSIKQSHLEQKLFFYYVYTYSDTYTICVSNRRKQSLKEKLWDPLKTCTGHCLSYVGKAKPG